MTRASSLSERPGRHGPRRLVHWLNPILGAAVHYRIATGLHAGRKALTLRTVDSSPPPDNPGIAQLSGFSLLAPRMV